MGCVRTNNEDNFAYDAERDFYVVCDGMGGMAAGEVASAIACSTVIDTYAAQPAETAVLIKLSLAIRAANDAVRHSSAHNPEQQGMGTTLVAAVVEGNKLFVANVGDSRAYLLQKSACMQLTVDHSYINELVRNGTVRVEDIHSVDLKGLESVITRAIGAAPEVDPDFFAVDLSEDDTLLLASDGLTRYVDSSRIAALIDPTELDQSCQRLIQAAKDGGGADNITCLLLRYNGAVALEAALATQDATPDSVVTTVGQPDAPDLEQPIEPPVHEAATPETASAKEPFVEPTITDGSDAEPEPADLAATPTPTGE
jgi:serine/threonine protein phosphatase PrpC